MARNEMLDIVNENDEIIGRETRGAIHNQGLLHREIHVWFITPSSELILQHRAKDKDTYPDLLDATVGGHVEPGMTYEETALKEMAEETGVRAALNDLHLLKVVKSRSVDEATGKINNAFRPQYGYVYKGDVADLKIEKGKAIGFEAWPLDKIYALTDEEKKRFIPGVYSSEFLEIFKDLRKLL